MEHVPFDRPLIGEILIKRNRITSKNLEHALGVQRQENGFIGEILVKLGYVDDRDIVVALVIQCCLPYIAVNKYSIEPSVVKLIPKDIALQERVIALDKVGSILSVVMTNPLTVAQKIKLEGLTGCRIATFISTWGEIQEAIARHYS